MNTTRYLGLIIKHVGISWYVPLAPTSMLTMAWRHFDTKREAMDWIRSQVRG